MDKDYNDVRWEKQVRKIEGERLQESLEDHGVDSSWSEVDRILREKLQERIDDS